MDISGRLITEEEIKAEFKEIMLCLKAERNNKFPIKGKDLAEMLSKTVNYFSAVENGNEFPSMKLFLSYLMLCNFDITPLKSLKIQDSEQGDEDKVGLSSKRVELIETILGLNEAQLGFLMEQAKIAKVFNLRQKKN